MRFSLILALTLSIALTACSDSGSDPPEAQHPAGHAATASSSTNTQATAPAPVTRGNPGQPAAAAPRRAQPFDPNAFALELEPVARGFQSPTLVTHAPDGSGRLFVLEQAGRIRIIQNGQTLPEPFLDIVRIVRSGGEQGLLGLAFHPQYTQNGRFFVHYTNRSGDHHIVEFRVSSSPDVADSGSERLLLFVEDPFDNHNGGGLAFGPDGMLYIGLGDGGSGGDPLRNGQNLAAALGKLLRIDVDRGTPFAIPPDNPFVGNPQAFGPVWAYGLRNPWRFAFDRATGDLFIGDVGQNVMEEIDFSPAPRRGNGENYGWN